MLDMQYKNEGVFTLMQSAHTLHTDFAYTQKQTLRTLWLWAENKTARRLS